MSSINAPRPPWNIGDVVRALRALEQHVGHMKLAIEGTVENQNDWAVQREALTHEVESWQNRSANLDTENVKLAEQVETLNAEGNRLQELVNELRAENSRDTNRMREEAHAHLDTIESLTRELAAFKQQLANALKQRGEWQEAHEQLHKMNDELREGHNHVHEQLAKTILERDNYKSNYDYCLKDLNATREALAEEARRNNLREHDVANLKADITEITKHRDNLQREVKANRDSYNSEIARLRKAAHVHSYGGWYIGLVHREGLHGDYLICFPDLPGCISAGSTLDECLRNAKEAVALHIEGIYADGKNPPAARILQMIMKDFNADTALCAPLVTYEIT